MIQQQKKKNAACHITKKLQSLFFLMSENFKLQL